MNRHFTKEDIHEANKHMKRCSSSLVIREMQIKTTLRYHLMPVRMAIILTEILTEKMLRAAREKGQVTHKVKPIRLTAGLSAETLQARRE